VKRLRGAVISVRVSSDEKSKLLAAAMAKDISASRFLRESGLKVASALLGDEVASGHALEVSARLQRPGPKGVEGKGWKLGLSLRVRLNGVHGEELAGEWMGRFQEALAKNDHLDCWFCLEHCLPLEIQGIPERSQVRFLKSFMAALSEART